MAANPLAPKELVALLNRCYAALDVARFDATAEAEIEPAELRADISAVVDALKKEVEE